jgi:hypothetical protein
VLCKVRKKLQLAILSLYRGAARHLKAVAFEAAVGIWAIAVVGISITGRIAFCSLDGVDEFRLTHLAGVYAQLLCLLFYVFHFHICLPFVNFAPLEI